MRNQKRTQSGIILIALFGLLISCNNEDPFDSNAQFQKELQQIDDYLAANLIPAVKDPLGIRIVITKFGTGLPPRLTSTVDVDYKGTLFSTGATFEEDNTREVLETYIGGWQIALRQLPEGSEATLYIPSYWGYGNVAQSDDIPANATLVFEIKLKDVINPTLYSQKLASDTVAIDNYLDSKSIAATTDSTGIRYVITTPGGGDSPGWYSKLKLTYSIKLLSDDTKTLITLDPEPNDSYYSRPVDYIHGMLIGLLKMQEGTKATLYIPSSLAFGPEGVDQSNIYIPPDANVIIEVELKDVL
jgi:FKBP-type peptidyl-prolyl cis-trans isomerase